MTTNHSQIRSVVERCFAQRTAGPLFELLGFSGDAVTAVCFAESAIPVDRCFLHGTRGVLAAYSFASARPLSPSEIARVSRVARLRNPAQLQLYIFADSAFEKIVVGSFGVGMDLLTLTLERGSLRGSDADTIAEMMPVREESGVALAALHARALDRSRLTRLFFADFAAHRDTIAQNWRGIPETQKDARNQLALLLLSRLMFLYFLQHRNHLANDPAFLFQRLRGWQRRKHAGTFYRSTLRPLFFYVLNRRLHRRPAGVRMFSGLPYLNGGLFERHYLERKYQRLDLPDDVLAPVFENLLERYRFTASESADAETAGVKDVGVDPEMLGRVFEGLMAERTRQTTGTFYTPAPVVDRLVRESLSAYLAPRLGEQHTDALIANADAHDLDAEQKRFANGILREVKVLDPACGSGAFLLGSLSRLAQARHALGEVDVLALRRDIVAHNLYGVDLQNDAAQLCALRLWLALVPGELNEKPQPLPNLDRQIRQGDSLVDVIDLRADAADTTVTSCVTQLAQTGLRYTQAEPEQRARLQRSLLASERSLARAWAGALHRRMKYQAAELRALSSQKDLFGQRTSEATAADHALAELQQRGTELQRLMRSIKSEDGRPFFSFAVHFAQAALHGFDVVVCNPPWVRVHNWTEAISALVRRRFEVCRAKAWRPEGVDSAPAAGHQIDLAMLFLERAIQLLAPEGVLGIILPAKFMRSLSGAAARRLLLREMEIISIEDHSLDQRSIFQADAFAAILVARKRKPGASSNAIAVTSVRRNAAPLQFTQAQAELPIIPGDAGAPWLLLPRPVRSAVRRMLESPAICRIPDLCVRRGVVTGANNVAVVTERNPKLGGLVAVRSLGHETAARPQDFEAVIEEAAVRPLVRGTDIQTWQHASQRFVIVSDGVTKTPRAVRYLSEHQCSLTVVARDARAAVAWQDISQDMSACVIPAGIIALNTVYFIPAHDDVAHLLCAYFNSLPFRVCARSIAERAKDAHFRFFAWSVALLPLPAKWRTYECAKLRDLSMRAHADATRATEVQGEIDALVANAYGLARAHIKALSEFDAWLRGK